MKKDNPGIMGETDVCNKSYEVNNTGPERTNERAVPPNMCVCSFVPTTPPTQRGAIGEHSMHFNWGVVPSGKKFVVDFCHLGSG